MSYDAQKVTYQEVTIFDRPALFTECRIDRTTVPEGVYRLSLIHIFWKGDNAHDIYGFSVCHLASPLSFFGSVRFFSYSLSFSFAQSGIFSGLATPRMSEASQRQRSPEYSS